MPIYSDRFPWMLPDFTRVIWIKNESEALWRLRIKQLAELHKELEWRTVATGIRSCALTFRRLNSLKQVNESLSEYNLVAAEVQIHAAGGGAYINGSRTTRAGEASMARIVIGRAYDVRKFMQAWKAKDNDKMGELLGYPLCCRKFFLNYWIGQRCIDTTWPMAIESVGSAQTRQLEINGLPATNIFWRWLGIRAVSHLPCSFNCSATAELAGKFRNCAQKIIAAEQLQWQDELLNMPVEWSALHGIAEITNPLLRIVTQTDATAGKYVVRWTGTAHHGFSLP
jgi:hypothetical protein